MNGEGCLHIILGDCKIAEVAVKMPQAFQDQLMVFNIGKFDRKEELGK